MNSPSMIVYLALVAFATTSLVAAELSDSELKKVYSQIDSLLAKKLAGEFDNAKLTMNVLMAKLKKEDKRHMFRKKNVNLVYGLKSLIELTFLDGPEKCSDRAYQILMKVDRLTDGRGSTSWQGTKARRSHIDSLIHHYSVKRAEECISAHARNFERVHESVSKASLQIIEPFLSKVVYRHLCGFVPSNQNMDDCNPTTEQLGNLLPLITSFVPADGPVILEELELLTSRTPDERLLRKILSIPDRSSISELTHLIKKYLLNPCKDYHEGFSNSVFAQAQFDDKMLDTQVYNEDLSDFYIGWANFRLCSSMIKSPNALSNYVLEYTSRRM